MLSRLESLKVHQPVQACERFDSEETYLIVLKSTLSIFNGPLDFYFPGNVYQIPLELRQLYPEKFLPFITAFD